MLDRILIGSSAEPSDPDFENVTLLLHGDGSNGAQNNTFIDSSTNNFTITRNGNTTQGSFSPYGSNWSNYFDGSGDYLTAPSNAAFGMGTGDFTIEMWVFFNAAQAEKHLIDNGTSSGIFLKTTATTIGIGRAMVAEDTMFTYSFAQGTWYHIAFTRSGSTVYGFVNGTQIGSATNTINYATGACYIGAAADATKALNGYISNVRIVKGTAVYTSAFTPPTQPLTAITNTSLLTCAYNRFRDGSTNNFTITSNGDVKVTNFSPFAPSSSYSTTTNGGSGYFSGNGGNYISGPSNSAFAVGTGDFTVDFWAYFTNSSDDNGPIVDTRTSSSNGVLIRQGNGAGGIANRVDCNCAGTTASSGTITFNAWTHVAVVRSSNSLKIYINGVGGTAVTASGNATGTNSFIGAFFDGTTTNFDGYLSNLRFIKGTAVYSADFTPPTSPTTAVTNTQLLLNATNAAIFDNSMKNDLETVGNAQISTSVKKFGTGSMAFDGNGDALVAAYNDALNVTSGDFTIEGWVYFNAVSGTPTLITPFGTGTDYGGWVIALDSSSRFTYYLSSSVNSWNLASNVLFSSTAAVTGTWYHFALVRSGSTFTPYLNGTAGTTTTTSSALYNHSRPIKLGAEKDANSFPLNGYLDDVRITKGIARYTANFTAPTAPFPNK